MIRKQVDLTDYNTLGLTVTADYFIEVKSDESLKEAIDFSKKTERNIINLGQGSNVVFNEKLHSLVVKNAFMGIDIIKTENAYVYVKVGAGVDWHTFVIWTLKQGFFGLENLSLIPGTVGATPIQNVGAYGVEIKDFFHVATAYLIETKENIQFNNEQCKFSYRNSIFKNIYKDKIIITEVIFKLNTQFKPNLGYGQLSEVVERMTHGHKLTALDVSQAVCAIRKQKLPSNNNFHSVGSFFKNPIVSEEKKNILSTFALKSIIGKQGDLWKISAGWMIEQCKFKNHHKHGVSVYQRQALVLINTGNATFKSVLSFAEEIRVAVQDKFGVLLEIEPSIYNN